MSFYGYLAFCGAYTLSVATPGPGVAAVLARSAAYGMRGTPAFIMGFAVGGLLWFFAAALGLAALARSAQPLFLAVKYLGALYLLYLAYRLWTAPAQVLEAPQVAPDQKSLRLFFGSLALTLGNPKAMIFFLALMPTVVPLHALGPQDFLAISLAIVIILCVVLGTYAWTASRAGRVFRDPNSLRLINRGAGATLAGVAVVVATR